VAGPVSPEVQADPCRYLVEPLDRFVQDALGVATTPLAAERVVDAPLPVLLLEARQQAMLVRGVNAQTFGQPPLEPQRPLAGTPQRRRDRPRLGPHAADLLVGVDDAARGQPQTRPRPRPTRAAAAAAPLGGALRPVFDVIAGDQPG